MHLQHTLPHEENYLDHGRTCCRLADFQTVNELYGSYFKSDPPARSTVQVPALPKGANVEIEVIAMANPTSGKAINTWE